MKIIDAIWEKRNLGVDAMEFEIEDNDDVTVVSAISVAEKQYNVVKIPANKPELVKALQKSGYAFIECVLTMSHSLSRAKMDAAKRYVRLPTVCEIMDESDKTELFRQIGSGIFNSDRIYNDSHFTGEAAAQRYINWIIDECDRGANVYKTTYKNSTIGFFSIKSTESDGYYPFLAGIYRDYTDKGFGLSLIHNILVEGVRRSAKRVIATVSSNNLPIIRVDELLGFEIQRFTYVFAKHKQ